MNRVLQGSPCRVASGDAELLKEPVRNQPFETFDDHEFNLTLLCRKFQA